MELHSIPTVIAVADADGWHHHEARLTGLDDQGATAEVHFDLPDQLLDRALLLQVDMHGDPVLALCEHRPPERTEPGVLYLRFVDAEAVHHGTFGELIDLQKAS